MPTDRRVEARCSQRGLRHYDLSSGEGKAMLSGGGEEAGHEDLMRSWCDVISIRFESQTSAAHDSNCCGWFFQSQFSRVCQSNTFVAAGATLNTQIRSGATMSFYSNCTVNIEGQNQPTPKNDPFSLMHFLLLGPFSPFLPPSLWFIQMTGFARSKRMEDRPW